MTATLTQSTTAVGPFEVCGLSASRAWHTLSRGIADLDTAIATAEAWASAVDDLPTIVRNADGVVWGDSTEVAVGRFVRIENPYDAIYEGVVTEVRVGGEIVLDNVTAWYHGGRGVYVGDAGDWIILRASDDATVRVAA